MRHFALPALVVVCSCSALVEIDDDKYLAGSPNSVGDGDGDGAGAPGDGDGDTGGDGDGDGDTGGGDGDGDSPNGGSPSGGMGGTSTGGGGTGGSGGTGGNGSGGEPEGTGGVVIQIPEPVHYYPLDGNADDEGSASPLPATVTGNVAWHAATGLQGGSLELPLNADTYLTFDPLIAGSSPFTISWWFISSNDGYITLASRFTTGQTISWELVADTEMPRVKIANKEIFFEADFPKANEGKWIHVAIGYKEMANQGQDSLNVWINGQPVLAHLEVLNPSTVASDGNLVIGQGGNGTSRFSGILDEIRVYNELLTDDEVEALYLYDAPQ